MCEQIDQITLIAPSSEPAAPYLGNGLSKMRSLLELGALTPGVTYKDVYGKSDAKIDHEIDIM